MREQLLRAGVAPHYARRYVTELREHLADLEEREHKAGLDAASAFARAHELLGTESLLSQAAIETAPRSLAALAPWAVFGILPARAFICLFATIIYYIVRVLGPAHASWPGGEPNSYTGLISSASIVTNYLLGPACVAGTIPIALRQRLLSGWVWLGLGLTAFLSGVLGFHMTILPPIGETPRGAVFSAVPAVYINGQLSGSATFTMVTARAATLFSAAGLAYHLLQKRLFAIQS